MGKDTQQYLITGTRHAALVLLAALVLGACDRRDDGVPDPVVDEARERTGPGDPLLEREALPAYPNVENDDDAAPYTRNDPEARAAEDSVPEGASGADGAAGEGPSASATPAGRPAPPR